MNTKRIKVEDALSKWNKSETIRNNLKPQIRNPKCEANAKWTKESMILHKRFRNYLKQSYGFERKGFAKMTEGLRGRWVRPIKERAFSIGISWRKWEWWGLCFFRRAFLCFNILYWQKIWRKKSLTEFPLVFSILWEKCISTTELSTEISWNIYWWTFHRKSVANLRRN